MKIAKVDRKLYRKNEEHDLMNFFYEIDDALIQNDWKDFSGAYDDKGRPNFHFFIDDEEIANRLIEDGLTVKIVKPRNEDDPIRWRVKVLINGRNLDDSECPENRKPEIFRVDSESHKSRQLTNTKLLSRLDKGYIEVGDMTLAPWWYDYAGNQGYNLYLNWGQFVVQDDNEEAARNRMRRKYEMEDVDEPEDPDIF